MKLVAWSGSVSLLLTDVTKYIVTSVDGLAPAAANINTTKIATYDGSVINSRSVEKRNIVITVYLNGSIESNRQALYAFFAPTRPVTLEYVNDGRHLWIDGYVESFEGSFFSRAEMFQISVICPDPYFSSRVERTVTHSGTSSFTVNNQGDAPCGMLITLTASGAVQAPEISVNGETFSAVVEMTSGNVLTVNTRKGHKACMLGNDNVLYAVPPGAVWVQLKPGQNTVTVNAASGGSRLSTVIKYTALYVGG